MAEAPLYKRLTELNERLAALQSSNNPADAEEFVRLYQERRELLKRLDPPAARVFDETGER